MLPVAAAVAALTVLLAGIVAGTAQAYIARARATAAADAAALAAAPVTFRPFGAAGGPEDEAARFAGRHGAVLISCTCARDPSYAPRRATVEVEVQVDIIGLGPRRFRAAATAEFEPLELFDP